MESAKPQLDEVAGQNLFEQVLGVWVQPEIERRKAAGVLPANFTLFVIQLLFHPGRDRAETRFNEEVKGEMKLRANRTVEAGQPVYDTDIAEIAGFNLVGGDTNAGHITLLLVQDNWHISFDFRYNAALVRDTVDAGSEFLVTAREALTNGRMRSVVENLFGATELMSKAYILMLPGDRILKNHKHGFIAARFNAQARYKHVDAEFPQLLNRLSEIRGAARYLRGSLSLAPEEATRLVETADRMHEDLLRRIPEHARLGRRSF